MLIYARAGNTREQHLNFVVKGLRGGLESCLDGFRIKLKHANVSARWQIRLEVGLIEFEKTHYVTNRIHGGFKLFVGQTVDVKLFVAPVYFKDWLETPQEITRLAVS